MVECIQDIVREVIKMKEKIYTIPVNEAYDTDCECPMCVLERNLEEDALGYTLGAAMMEEDFRGHSDKTGYCNRHFSLLLSRQNKLPLALILDTHMQEIRKKIAILEKHAPSGGGGLFKKKGGAFTAETEETLRDISNGCVVCEKISATMERYADVLIYMWLNDDAFRAKFDKSKGLCLKHTMLLAKAAPKSASSHAGEFLSAVISKEKAELDRIQDDIHRFTQKFDYRNKDMDWGTAKDAPVRTIEKISGYVRNSTD